MSMAMLRSILKSKSEDTLIRRHLFLFLGLFLAAVLLAALILRIGYLYVEVGKGVAENDGKSPSIFYGRPLEIRTGDHLGNIRFAERLNKLSYKKVRGNPSAAGLVVICLRSPVERSTV